MGVWVCGVLVWVGAGLGEVGEVWVGVAVVRWRRGKGGIGYGRCVGDAGGVIVGLRWWWFG